MGSITSLTAANGSIVKTYTYDSFGRNAGQTGSVTNPFLFTAREFDSETDLYYYPAAHPFCPRARPSSRIPVQ